MESRTSRHSYLEQVKKIDDRANKLIIEYNSLRKDIRHLQKTYKTNLTFDLVKKNSESGSHKIE